jgi:FkbM family methyltransferase
MLSASTELPDPIRPRGDSASLRERFERETLDAFCFAYTPTRGDVVVDIGAGIGEQALTFSHLVGEEGRVISIEAQPRIFGQLTATIDGNGLENVEAVHLAVTDGKGRAEISDSPEFGYVYNTVVAPGQTVVSVPAETLDGIYARFDLERVDLLKMNIEGSEGLAIAKWDEALRRTRHLAIACHDFLVPRGAPASYATYEAVRSAIEKAGFTVRTRTDDPQAWNRCTVYGSNRACGS